MESVIPFSNHRSYFPGGYRLGGFFSRPQLSDSIKSEISALDRQVQLLADNKNTTEALVLAEINTLASRLGEVRREIRQDISKHFDNAANVILLKPGGTTRLSFNEETQTSEQYDANYDQLEVNCKNYTSWQGSQPLSTRDSTKIDLQLKNYSYLQQTFCRLSQLFSSLDPGTQGTYWQSYAPASTIEECVKFTQQFNCCVHSNDEVVRAKARARAKGENEQERKENHKKIFACARDIDAMNGLQSCPNMSIDEYQVNLAKQLLPGNAALIDRLEIVVPRESSYTFAYVISADGGISLSLLDFTQLALHELGHAIAYMSGECIDPNTPFTSALEYSYSNPEELRNILLAEYSENHTDLEGKQRLGHKAASVIGSERMITPGKIAAMLNTHFPTMSQVVETNFDTIRANAAKQEFETADDTYIACSLI